MEAGTPAGGVTGAAFGWIGPQCPAGRADAALKRAAMPAWQRLEADIGRPLAAWTGALLWRSSEAETATLLAEEGAQRGRVPLTRNEVASCAPALVAPPALAALEGAADPAVVTDQLVMAARHAGANIVTGSGPATLATSGAGVTGVRVQERVIAADTVVVAAGIGTRLLCCAAGLDLPLHGSPAVRVRLRCAHPTAAMIHEGPLCEVRSVAGGILAADDWREGVPLHDIAGGVVAAVRSTYRGADDVSVVDAVVGERPMPNDGPPLIGRARGIGGLYVAVMHSGVTLAPVVADLGTREILKDTREPLLEGCRPDR